MVSPLNSLTNMEYMLYGGASGVNPNCPSFTNGYMANRNSWNYQMPYGYNNQSIWNNQYPASGVGSTNTNSQATQADAQTSFNGSAKDMETLEKYYLKGQNPSESLLGTAVGGAGFAIVNNMRLLAHPAASLRALPDVEKMFAEAKKGGKLAELWTNPDTHKIMTDAYHKMHKLEGASKWRFAPLFKKRIDEKVYTQLKKEMELALKSKNVKDIAIVTEKIKIVTGAKTGIIPEFWRNMMGSEPIKQKIEDTVKNKNYATVKAAAEKSIASKKALSYGEAIKKGFKSQGIKGGAFFAAMEFIMDFGKIRSAFSKDSSTGAKQLGQTSVKAAGSVIGWTVGEAVGAAAGAKIGAAVGTAVCPGLGTAIGAVAGLVGGSIGTWAMGKLTKAIVGEDVGSKVEAKKLAQTKGGQAQLLEITMQQAQEDLKKNKLDPKVAQALQNVIGQYNAVA